MSLTLCLAILFSGIILGLINGIRKSQQQQQLQPHTSEPQNASDNMKSDTLPQKNQQLYFLYRVGLNLWNFINGVARRIFIQSGSYAQNLATTSDRRAKNLRHSGASTADDTVPQSVKQPDSLAHHGETGGATTTASSLNEYKLDSTSNRRTLVQEPQLHNNITHSSPSAAVENSETSPDSSLETRREKSSSPLASSTRPNGRLYHVYRSNIPTSHVPFSLSHHNSTFPHSNSSLNEESTHYTSQLSSYRSSRNNQHLRHRHPILPQSRRARSSHSTTATLQHEEPKDSKETLPESFLLSRAKNRINSFSATRLPSSSFVQRMMTRTLDLSSNNGDSSHAAMSTTAETLSSTKGMADIDDVDSSVAADDTTHMDISSTFDGTTEQNLDASELNLLDLPPTDEIPISELPDSGPRRKRSKKAAYLRKKKRLESLLDDAETDSNARRMDIDEYCDSDDESYGEDGFDPSEFSPLDDDTETELITLGVKRPRPLDSEEEQSLEPTGKNFLPVKKRARMTESSPSVQEEEDRTKPTFLRVVSFLTKEFGTVPSRDHKDESLFKYTPSPQNDKDAANSLGPRTRRRIPISSPKALKQTASLLQSKEDIMDFRRRTTEVIADAMKEQDEKDKLKSKETLSFSKDSSAFSAVNKSSEEPVGILQKPSKEQKTDSSENQPEKRVTFDLPNSSSSGESSATKPSSTDSSSGFSFSNKSS